MKIHLKHIPQGETLHLEGEESAAGFGLEAVDAVPAGPLKYSLDAGLSGGGLFVTGVLSLKVRMRCVVTLELFEKEIVIDPFAVQKELDGRELVDLTDEAREDIHLALPAHPRSDAACEVGRHSSRSRGEDQDSRSSSPGSGPSPWQALDQIKTK